MTFNKPVFPPLEFSNMKVLGSILLLVCVVQANAQFRLPQGKNMAVTLDGIADPQEWDKAMKIPLAANYNLYLMADSTWLYLAAFGPQNASPYADLYIKTTAGLMNLHASMQLGERLLPEDNSWDDEKPGWNWGNNTHWTANTVTYKPGASENLPFHEQVKLYQGQEFKISLSRLESVFSLLIVIRDFVDPAIHVSFPPEGNVYNAGSWKVLSVHN